MEQSEKVLTFIREELLEDQNVVIEMDTSLFQDRVLDSLNLVTLITFLEEAFDLKISPYEVSIENLDSINNILAFLKEKGV